MVERPIKKSERQSEDTADTGRGNSDSKPPVKPTAKGLGRSDNRSSDNRSSDNRSSGRGKKAYEADESKQSVNPALARGPKPVKTQAPVTRGPETETELVSEEPQDEATEG